MGWETIGGTHGAYEFNAEAGAVRNSATKKTLKIREKKGALFYRMKIGGKDCDITLASIKAFRTGGRERARACPVCGKEFVPYSTRSKFCSRRCKKKNDNIQYNGFHIRRARKYGVPFESGITLPAVIERFGGVCQICGKQTDKRSFALQPTIDHIVPMRRGGGHTWDNVQLACFKCNSIKAADECDEELATA